MRLLLTLLLIQSISNQTCSHENSKKPKVNLEFNFSYPVSYSKMGKTVNMFSLQDTVTIFSSDEYRIIRLHYQTLEFKTGRGIPGTEDYFIYEQGKQYGLHYKSIKDSIGTKMRVDSILQLSKTKMNGFESLTDTIWMLTDKGTLLDGIIFEKYTVINKYKPTIFDSIYYYFDPKLNNVDYTFSPSLDSLRKMKLFKARLIYGPTYIEKDNVMLPTREFTFTMKPTSEKMSKPMEQLLERFKNEKL